MAKAFLSHSSKDKSFVEIVAGKLDRDSIVYDAWTFEEGNKTLEEIFSGIESSDLFVLFLSESSLESKWVRQEILIAEMRLADNLLKRIYPIIIDSNISHKDPRIPDWLRRQYNLKYISKSTKVAERIKQQIRIIYLELFPEKSRLENLFIGRTELIRKFEERIFNYSSPAPVAIIASGLPSIGRRKFTMHALKNSNKIREYYNPPTISLNARNSIEDFIQELFDKGYSEKEKVEIENLISQDIKSKVLIAIELLKEIKKHEEIIYIIDNYSIIIEDGSVVEWFHKIVETIKEDNTIYFCLISRTRLRHYLYNYSPEYFPLEIPELERYERKALFNALLGVTNIQISNDEFEVITDLFNGFPEQVTYTYTLLLNEGVDFVMNNTNLIVDYNSEKVYQILKDLDDNITAQSILNLLADFDYISINLMIDLIDGDNKDDIKSVLGTLIMNFIVEFIDATKTYIRLNDSIRDHVQRIKSLSAKSYQEKLQLHVKNSIQNISESEDLSDVLITIQEGLKNGIDIPQKLLMPSHYLNAMRELYTKERKFNDVVKLAERVLGNERFLDRRIVHDIRYWLCLSLCRLRNNRLLKEVQAIKGPDHNYLLGFYYRLLGKHEQAIESFKKVFNDVYDSPKAKRELVQVYLSIEDYTNAISYARDVYERDTTNPYNAQSYFRCLVREYGKDKKTELQKIIENISKIKTDKAREILLISQAQLSAYVDGNFIKAIQIIDDAIHSFPSNIYPYLTKFEICKKFKRWDEMDNAINIAEKRFRTDSELFSKINYLSSKVLLLISKGHDQLAEKIINEKIRHRVPQYVIQNLEDEIKAVRQQRL